jgi:phosphoribosylanthranilate isomerase
MVIKVCGLKYYENIKEICLAGADLIGLIFYKDSPRYVNGSLDFDEIRNIPVNKVGVFVDENMYSVLDKIAHYDLEYVQLHGKEDPQYCSELKQYVKVIKAFGIKDRLDTNELKRYEEHADLFLFDTASEKNGGSGIAFDHSILYQYDLGIPFLLSGGISPEHADQIKELRLKQLYGIDINSKFETAPGSKDTEKVKRFIQKIK